MANIRELPGAPGSFEVVGTDIRFTLKEWRAGSIYDSVQLAAVTPTAGTKSYFFRDVTNKNLQHNNLDNNAGRMPAHTSLIVNRIALYPNQSFSNTLATESDIIKFATSAVLEVYFNGDRKVCEGPAYQFASGYGAVVTTTANNVGTGTLGIASEGSVSELLVAQKLNEGDAMRGEMTFYDNAWLATPSVQPTFASRLVVTCHLVGLVKKDALR